MLRLIILTAFLVLAGCRSPVRAPRDPAAAGGATAISIVPAAATAVRRWTIRVDPQPTATVPAAFAEPSVYLFRGGALERVEAGTGRVLWSRPSVHANFLVRERDGFVVLKSFAGLQAFRADTGEPLWSQPEAGGEAEMDVAGGRVFVHTPNRAAAFDVATGSPVWSERIGGGYNGDAESLALRAADGGGVLQLNDSPDTITPEAFGFDPHTGVWSWRQQGRIVAIQGDEVYLHKAAAHEVWVRRLTDGTFLRVIPIEGHDGGYLEVREGLVLYSALQSYFVPPRTLIRGEAAFRIAAARELRREVVARSAATGDVRWFVRLPGEGPFACAATNRLLCVLTRNRRASAFPLPCRVETYDLARGAPMFRVDAEEGIRRVDGAGRHLYVRTFGDEVHDLEWYARP